MACVRGKTCPECNGRRKIDGEKCYNCDGTGKVADHKLVALPGRNLNNMDFQCAHGCGYWSNNDGYGSEGKGPYPD